MTNNNQQTTKIGNPLLQKGSNLFDSDYIVKDYIGSGGFGDVYRITDPKKPNLKLAAKVIYKKVAGLSDDAWNSLSKEASNSLRVLNKTNLIQTYYVLTFTDEDDAIIVFIMDYLEGQSLADYLTKNGCLVPVVALKIFLKILNGIQHLHNYKRQIIHRDLKPANIMLSDDLSKATVIDFGIATVIERTEQVLEGKSKGKVLSDELALHGTPSYIIPDAIVEYGSSKNKAERNISVQYDFYSLGVILYEMIIGQLPFDTKGIDEQTDKGKVEIIKLPLKYDILNISANPSIPTSLENIIFKCMACKRDDVQYRYNKIEEIIADVENVIPKLNKEDSTPLIKPLHKRIYQHAHLFNIDVYKERQRFYKKWWFLILVVGVSLVFLIACIIVFFVV